MWPYIYNTAMAYFHSTIRCMTYAEIRISEQGKEHLRSSVELYLHLGWYVLVYSSQCWWVQLWETFHLVGEMEVKLGPSCYWSSILRSYISISANSAFILSAQASTRFDCNEKVFEALGQHFKITDILFGVSGYWIYMEHVMKNRNKFLWTWMH